MVIFAPHIDDEVIGCFTLLKEGKISKVYYFFETDDVRLNEAKKVAEKFNVEIEVADINNPPKVEDTILLPSGQDLHIHHKMVNRLKYSYKNVKFYSIDMNRKPKPLPEKLRDEKKKVLYELFPSQKKLFDSDEKYYLFEDIYDDDTKRMIWVTFQKKGIHYFKQAKTEKSLEDVSYLGYPHRHLFKFKVAIEINHNDRDIEFHQFLNFCEGLYEENILELNGKSCEMIADDLAVEISKKYKDRKLIIDVSEDGEVGATNEYQI